MIGYVICFMLGGFVSLSFYACFLVGKDADINIENEGGKHEWRKWN